MTTNQDITIFNLRVDKKTRREVLVPTNISGVSYYDVRSSTGNAGEKKENITYKIRIPIDARVENERSYISEHQYSSLDDAEALKYWTIQKGALILLGTFFVSDKWIFDEFNFRSGVILADKIEDIQGVAEQSRDYITVVEYADNTKRGSVAVKHWRIGGA